MAAMSLKFDWQNTLMRDALLYRSMIDAHVVISLFPTSQSAKTVTIRNFII